MRIIKGLVKGLELAVKVLILMVGASRCRYCPDGEGGVVEVDGELFHNDCLERHRKRYMEENFPRGIGPLPNGEELARQEAG